MQAETDKTASAVGRHGVWAHTPIQYKLILTVGLIFATLAVLLYLAMAQTSSIMGASYEQENEYYNINSFQNSLVAADDALQSYLRSPADGQSYVDEWNSLCRTMRTQLSRLKRSPDEVGVEQYLLARALCNGFEPYADKGAQLLAMWDNNAGLPAMYAAYEKLSLNTTYLLAATRQLQSAALTSGQATLADLRVENDTQRRFFMLLMLLAMLFLAGMVNELVRSIVSPVLRLSEASRAISEGNFDTPDVEVANRDEIYTLARAFNGMKDSMKRLFAAMQEKAEIEQELYQKDLEASESRRLLEMAKMQQLRSQINPHFLFNTLNLISRTARSEKAVRSEKLILALARLFRYNLKTDAAEVPLQREMNIVNDYISIQSTRFESRVSFYWRVAPEVSPADLLVPAFVLQPMVENAVIHGLEPKMEGGVIRIRAHILGDALHLIISDNGVGMDTARRQLILSQQRAHGDVSGIGVGNVRSRLQMLQPGSRFAVYSRPGRGTCIHIVLPGLRRAASVPAAPGIQ